MRATACAVDSKCMQRGLAQILVEYRDRRSADDVDWSLDREGGYRRPAGERLQHHQSERVGAAGEYENVGGAI